MNLTFGFKLAIAAAILFLFLLGKDDGPPRDEKLPLDKQEPDRL